jgi:futalosine hydrolase
MHKLLVSATTFEIRKTIQWLEDDTIPNNVQKPELLITGIGQLKTASALQKKIAVQRPGLVIQAGFGGSSKPENVGKVYAIASDNIADLGAMEKQGFQTVFDLGLENPDEFPFQKGRLINPREGLLKWTGLPVMDGMTVNEIKSEDFAGFQRNSRPVVESMEGAALHYVCLMEKIPFLQIRAITNVIGDRDKSRWKIDEAAGNLHEALVRIISNLKMEEIILNETLEDEALTGI